MVSRHGILTKLQQRVDEENIVLWGLMNRNRSALTQRMICNQVDKVNQCKDTLEIWQRRIEAEENR